MKERSLRVLNLLVFLVLTFSLASSLQAQYVYVAKLEIENIGGYRIGPHGELTPLPGSPFATCCTSTQVAADPLGRFVYVVTRSGVLEFSGILAFKVGPTGELIEVAGSQFAPGLESAVVDPTGRYLFGTIAGNTASYRIESSGALTATGSVVAGAGPIAVDPSGRFLYVASQAGNNVLAYKIGLGGGLTSNGAPVAAGNGPRSLAADPTGRYLYVVNEGSNSISAYAIGPTGRLTEIAGSPFPVIFLPGHNGDPNFVAVDPTGRFAYVTGRIPSVIFQYRIETTGALTALGWVSTGIEPVWMAADPTGKFLYVTPRDSHKVWAYSIGPTGELTFINSPEAGIEPVSVAVSGVQGSILSGSLWRSFGFDSGNPPTGWETIDFNDSAWPPARAPYPRDGATPGQFVPGTNAEFMWYDPLGTSTDGTTGTIHGLFRYTFRENLKRHSRPLVGVAQINVDDDYDLFVNGKLAFQNHDGGFANVLDRVNFSSFLRNGKNVIAIHAVDGGWDNPRDRIFESVMVDAKVQPVPDLLVMRTAGKHAHGDVLRYDGRAGAFIGEFADGCNPVDMTYGPDQRLYIADTNHLKHPGCDHRATVQRFDGSTGKRDVHDPHKDFVVDLGHFKLGPGGIAFGPDDNLYITDPAADSVLRYQGPFGAQPGQFMDVFVSSVTGIKNKPNTLGPLLFGPDNNLYVSTGADIRRYDGPLSATPGAFVDIFLPAGVGRVLGPMVFGPDNNLYVLSGRAILLVEGPTNPNPGTFVPFIIVDVAPSGLAFGPEDDIFVSVSGGVSRYNGRNGELKGTFAVVPGNPTKLLFSAVPNFAFDLGDFNHDGCVDRDDLKMVLTCIQHDGHDHGHDQCKDAFDLTGDGKVNRDDANMLALLFTNPGGESCHHSDHDSECEKDSHQPGHSPDARSDEKCDREDDDRDGKGK